MKSGDGGRSAASGLFYQYLFTIETLLALLSADSSTDDTQVRIEDPRDAGIADTNVVDFAVYANDADLISIHQVKSVLKPSDSTISAGDALCVLTRMATAVDSPTYVLATNARPGHNIDRMQKILSGDQPDSAVLNELLRISINNNRATQALEALTSTQLTRLRRARVDATGESSGTIRSRIAVKLHDWRSSQKLPLGDRAANILENFLITDIFARAAGAHEGGAPTGRICSQTLTLREFKRLLANDSDVLAHAAGILEAGRGAEHVALTNQIERPELLAEILRYFNDIRSKKTRQCALTGPSGVGKTCLAAMYVHEAADSYDRVYWIDAQSDGSIAASVLRQGIGVRAGQSVAPDFDAIARAFKQSLSSFIGRSLVVFDNAQNSRDLRRWIAFRGNIDVLVTSTNRVDWTEFRRIPVTDMSPAQARDLLRSRLDMDVDTSADEMGRRANHAMDKLAVKLEHRPLALHIAASHFGSLANLVQGIDDYAGEIDILAHVLGDDRYDRGPYPSTFQAAIHLCLDRLCEETADAHSLTALDIIAAGSVVASRNIPAFLLLAIATRSPASVLRGLDAKAGLREQRAELLAALHRIQTQSLIECHTDLAGATPWELSIRLEMNEIVQHVVRQRLGSLPQTLNGTAA